MVQGSNAFNAVDLQRAASADVVSDVSGYVATPLDRTCATTALGEDCTDTLYNRGSTPVMVNATTTESGSAIKCALIQNTPTVSPSGSWIAPGNSFTITLPVDTGGLADGNSCTVTVTVTTDKDNVFKATTQYVVTVTWSI